MTGRGALLMSAVFGMSLSCAHTAVEPAEPAEPSPENVAPAPIREFDIPTIEKLGRAMYEQDRLAWIATDVLFAERTEQGAAEDGVRGWITSRLEGHDAVRFVRDGEEGPELLYDVVFAGDGPPIFSTPADRTLTPQERAQYDARLLALDDIPSACSDQYNTVALSDPESDGWLVWAIAASLDPNAVLIGGHYRFTISPDGKQIRARDALSVSCLNLNQDGSDERPVGSFMSHVVSLTPVETHSFASLNYKRVLHVGTRDGTAWRVAEGRITRVEQDAPDMDGFAARALAAVEETCGFITSKSSGPSKTYKPVAGSTKVIEVTERDEAFTVEDPPGEHVEALTCVRRDIVPSPNDYKVLAAGYSLAIADRGAGHPRRIGKLSLVNGKSVFEVLQGEPLTDELAQRVRKRLDAFDGAIAKSH